MSRESCISRAHNRQIRRDRRLIELLERRQLLAGGDPLGGVPSAPDDTGSNGLGAAPQFDMFREDFSAIWTPARENGAGCSWKAEGGFARVATMGVKPGDWIDAVYEQVLPFEIPEGRDFYYKAHIRVMDGDPPGALGNVGVNLTTADGQRICRLDHNDSQAASGYGGIQFSTSAGMVYTNDPDGFGRVNPQFDGVLELRRVGNLWTAFLDGTPLNSPVQLDVNGTAAEIQISCMKYDGYEYRGRDGTSGIDFIEVGFLPMREDFDTLNAWAPAPTNGAGCSWKAEGGSAMVDQPGYNPSTWIYTVYDRPVGFSIAPDADFYFKTHMVVEDGNGIGVISVRLGDDDFSHFVGFNYNDSWAGRGPYWLQLNTSEGNPWESHRSAPVDMSFDGVFELRRVDNLWSLYLDGNRVWEGALQMKPDFTKVEIFSSKYQDYAHRVGKIDYIEVGQLQRPTRDELDAFNAWVPAPTNGLGCSWKVEGGFARVATMGEKPGDWIDAVYERPLPFEIPENTDFYVKTHIRVMDGDPPGALGNVGVNLTTADGQRICRLDHNDSQAASGYGGIQFSTSAGMVYTNDPDGFGRVNPQFDGVLELRRVGNLWTALLDGTPLNSPVPRDVKGTIARVQISCMKYSTYQYRGADPTSGIDFIEVGDLVPVGLTIAGPDKVEGDTSTQYTASAAYAYGPPVDVTPWATWSEDSQNASISAGLLSAEDVSADQPCRVTAAYGGQSIAKDVVISPSPEFKITSGAGDDVFCIRRDGDWIRVWPNSDGTGGPWRQRLYDGITSISVHTGSGNDRAILDFASGNIIPSGNIAYDGGDGSDSLTLLFPENTPEKLSVYLDSIQYDGRRIFGTNIEKVLLSLRASTEFDSLQVADSLAVALAAGNRVFTAENLQISDTGTLDLADNDLIVQADALTAQGTLDWITRQIIAARDSKLGRWAGNGITSSAAAANSGGFAGLAGMRNINRLGGTMYGSFDEQKVDENSILVKYTWNGDTTLDGVINADDYFQIDSGFISQKKGYYNGDFNYDSVVNADDYFLIDSAFIGQSSPLATSKPDSVVQADAVVQQMAKKADPDCILCQLFSTEPVL